VTPLSASIVPYIFHRSRVSITDTVASEVESQVLYWRGFAVTQKILTIG